MPDLFGRRRVRVPLVHEECHVPSPMSPPPLDDDPPLDEIEQALVKMFTKILLREIRAGAAWWVDGPVEIVDADDPRRPE